MNQELKPCPFCGASEEELMLFCDPDEGRDNSGPSRRIQCAVCHIEAPFYPTEDDAIAAWNKRAPALESRLSDPDALAREIAANAYASAGNPLVARLVRNGQADHMPGFIAALAALSAPAQRVEEGLELEIGDGALTWRGDGYSINVTADEAVLCVRGVGAQIVAVGDDLLNAVHDASPAPAPHAEVDADVPDYDAGLLNDFGGGDVSWWQDYLRAEIERANQHWRAALGDRT